MNNRLIAVFILLFCTQAVFAETETPQDVLNEYLLNQSELFSSGENVDYAEISACIGTLAELGDSSSYHALFSVLVAGFPEVIKNEASGALDMIDGNYMQFLVWVILENPPDEKLAAFRAGMNSRRLGPAEQGQLAELALEQGLASTSAPSLLNPYADSSVLSALRYSSILAITRLQWTRASAMATRHFYRVMTDYLNGVVSRDRFYQAITCLGTIGSTDASLALALQLGLINAQTEKTGSFDEGIVLAMVQALGSIGDKAAFDYLFYISYLRYPANIQAAAKEALGRLRW